MRTLIIQLPTSLPGPGLTCAHAVVQTDTRAAQTATVSVQWAAPGLLPAADRQTDVVALLPPQALSWHRVELPAGLHKQPARLQAALAGLLEDRLLDDPAQLHLALQPDWQTAPRSGWPCAAATGWPPTCKRSNPQGSPCTASCPNSPPPRPNCT